MKRELSDALKDITAAIESAPGFYAKVQARAGLERLRIALEAGAFERTQKEYLAADLKALAEGKPVKTDLAKAVREKMTEDVAKARINVVFAEAVTDEENRLGWKP